jgi:hypothetical protein
MTIRKQVTRGFPNFFEVRRVLFFLEFIFQQELYIYCGFNNCIKTSAHPHTQPHPYPHYHSQAYPTIIKKFARYVFSGQKKFENSHEKIFQEIIQLLLLLVFVYVVLVCWRT